MVKIPIRRICNLRSMPVICKYTVLHRCCFGLETEKNAFLSCFDEPWFPAQNQHLRKDMQRNVYCCVKHQKRSSCHLLSFGIILMKSHPIMNKSFSWQQKQIAVKSFQNFPRILIQADMERFIFSSLFILYTYSRTRCNFVIKINGKLLFCYCRTIDIGGNWVKFH